MHWSYDDLEQKKPEQLERLCSEDTPATPWLPILLIHIGSQVKTGQSKSYQFKEFAKSSNFLIMKTTSHATHLLKLLDKMCKYKMDLVSIEDTEQTRFCPQTDRQTDRWTQGETSIPPFQLHWSRGYNDALQLWWFRTKEMMHWSYISLASPHRHDLAMTRYDK